MKNPESPKQITVGGENFKTGVDLFEFDVPSKAGQILVHSTGQRNIYFTFKGDDGFEYEGFSRCF